METDTHFGDDAVDEEKVSGTFFVDKGRFSRYFSWKQTLISEMTPMGRPKRTDVAGHC